MKTALITGGTSGIGLAAAKIFIERGYNCVIVGRNVERGRAALSTLDVAADRVHYQSIDVSKPRGCDIMIAETIRRFERLDVVVNSAGIYTDGSIGGVDETQFDAVIDTNVKGTFFVCRAAISELTKTHGSIVNVASDAGIHGNYYCALYAASKGAIVAFTKSLALELAHIPIRVNCVAPGDVFTPMTIDQMKRSGETIDDLAAIYPLRRIAAPKEVAEAIYFLASDKASFITGTILSVDGGLTA